MIWFQGNSQHVYKYTIDTVVYMYTCMHCLIRLSLQNFEKLSDRILEQLRQSTDPKVTTITTCTSTYVNKCLLSQYLIFIKSFFNWCGLYKLHHTERAWFDFFNRANRQKSKVFRKKSSTIDLQSMPQLLSEEVSKTVHKYTCTTHYTLHCW